MMMVVMMEMIIRKATHDDGGNVEHDNNKVDT